MVEPKKNSVNWRIVIGKSLVGLMCAVILCWVTWVSAMLGQGDRYTLEDAQKDFAAIQTSLDAIKDAAIDNGKRIDHLEWWKQHLRIPPEIVEKQIEGNTAQIVVLKQGQEMMRIDVKGMSGDIKYIVQSVDELKKNMDTLAE